jgi:signal transduction histidine kinase
MLLLILHIMAKEKTESLRKQLQELLTASELDYRASGKISNQLTTLDPKFQHFFVDAKTLIHLGRDSIKDHTTALIELVKNSYDADAHTVNVDIFSKQNVIRVADNGFGMTKDQLLNNWLRIGFSSKRQSKVSELGRRKTGEKGIGRISTDRLGAKLELISKTEADGLVGLRVDWDEFDTEGKDVADINVELTQPDKIELPLTDGKESKSGTEIRITDLRQPWTVSNIEGLYYELSALTPPFHVISDFGINLDNDVSEEFSKPVDSKYYTAAEIEVTTIFDGSNEVFYSIKDKYSKETIIETIDLRQFANKTTKGNSEGRDESELVGKETLPPMLNCGPVEVRLLFFVREGASVANLDFRLSDLREFLDNNAGVKVYRDQIAVKPYGFPKAQMGYDWLALAQRKARNPAGISRADEYAVTPNQVVGAVFISRDNNKLLTDSAAREGLVESEGFYDMKEFVYATLRLLEAHRARIYPTIEKNKNIKKKESAHREAEKLKERLGSVKEDLSSLRTEIEDNGESARPMSFLKPISRTIEKVEAIAEDVEITITELLNWQRVLNGLATIGISSAVFGHETEGSITQFQGSTNTAIKFIKLAQPNTIKALEELEKAYRHSKRVAAWGAYALTRVQKEKRSRRNTPILKTIESVVKELRPAFEASSIHLYVTGSAVVSKTFQMDIESILVNLLTNAYTACLLKGGERKIRVHVEREDVDGVSGYFFSVADTGPGIAKEFESRIFDPLFSTKSAANNESRSVGTGLGLTIVRSVIEELDGKISFTRDSELKGANFKIWLPKLS